jgi:hypothetical protein
MDSSVFPMVSFLLDLPWLKSIRTDLLTCFNTPTGPDKNSYYNEYFLRGKMFLAQRIPRMKLKGKGPRRPSSYQNEPDFYKMPFVEASSALAVNNDSKQATSGQQIPSQPILLAKEHKDDQGGRPVYHVYHPVGLSNTVSVVSLFNGQHSRLPPNESTTPHDFHFHAPAYMHHVGRSAYDGLMRRGAEQAMSMFPASAHFSADANGVPLPSLHSLVFQSIAANRSRMGALQPNYPQMVRRHSATGIYEDVNQTYLQRPGTSQCTLLAQNQVGAMALNLADCNLDHKEGGQIKTPPKTDDN